MVCGEAVRGGVGRQKSEKGGREKRADERRRNEEREGGTKEIGNRLVLGWGMN